ncbi:MAG: NADH-quinone oxidoreductase subunit NuoE [Geminicoccaceae bacterium]
MSSAENFSFTRDNEARVRAIIGRYPEGRQASAVLDLLMIAQGQCGGWLPRPVLDYVADYLAMPPIRVYEVASFYDMFNTKEVGCTQIRVCTTTPCWLCGSDDVLRACRDVLGIEVGQSTEDMRFYLREFECLGACANAPMMWIDDDYYEDLSYNTAKAIVEALRRGERPKPGPQSGRHTSTPQGGKTTLLVDPHTREVGAREEGQGRRDEEASEKARPEVEVKKQTVKVHKRGRPADGAGERSSAEPKDSDAR